ncbi:hypothetical protein O4J56_06420 [Nocardiopsis sp. RSe5-2]|uniref:FHA domain-containing protein n=1 Tax=Nocardiopsis endophytica TaxID=3018445 RepID=A0ABT4TZY7_9ACTN|nr:hypothetical protein [Nocardiopsis endophytica]MDA2810269.1 hypothetical protein [Nocardiopsis endophytica]
MNVERHLSRSAQTADALVDLSNVVRQQNIGPPGERCLKRLELVIEALAGLIGDRGATVYCVADESLARAAHEFPDGGDVKRLRSWIGQGLVEELPDADERLLDLAEMTAVPVITRDGFAGHRISHPFIQGNTEQFLRPVPAPGRTVALEARDMGVKTPEEISRKGEEDDLKPLGLLQGSHRKPRTDIVGRHWRCPEHRCSLYDRRKGSSVMLPRLRRGRPICQLHRVELRDDGPRTGIAQLKLLVDGECVERFTLDVDTSVVVGRLPGDGGIALHSLVPERLLPKMSRKHLEATVDKDTLRLRNLGRHGSRIWRPEPRPEGTWKPLSGTKGTAMRPQDLVEIVPGVHLGRSGRRFPAEISEAWKRQGGRDAPPEAGGETQLD